jgi:AmmeMemoRadiSam system protein B/AmmeMemoRadiSam system protein A
MGFSKDNFEVRRPMVAGMFYPSNPVDLAKQIAEMFSRAKKRILPGPVRAIVAPHAGYMYSGQIAADVYKQIEGEQFDTVVVVAPFHGFFKGVSVYSGGGYQTPLGVVEIDRKLSAMMSEKHPTVYSSTVGHTGSGGRGEHSLEVQLPFLQTVLGRFKMVAMIMGDQEESTIRATTEVLSASLKEKNVLLVASTDMSHYHPEKEARKLDKTFETALASFDSSRIINVVTSGKCEACGYGPVTAIVEAMKRLGGQEVEIISYDTSGSTTGDFSEVVGYLGAVITGKKVAPKKPAVIGTPKAKKRYGYNKEEKEYLLNLARLVVESKARGQKPEIPENPSPYLEEKRGAFVTLTKRGMLRGCIGLVQARDPLIDTIENMAVAAAFEDPRFPQVKEDELADLEYEISVMSPLSLVTDISTIVVGRDGLMIKLDLHSGLLLPQVATENHWDRITFLGQTCLKAGLSKNSYKDKQAKIYKFTVEKF